MDPITLQGAVKALFETLKFLYEITKKVKENKRECLRLCEHLRSVLDFVSEECRAGLPSSLEFRLKKLGSSMLALTETLDELSRKTLLQQVIWREHVSGAIKECYQDISRVSQAFQMGLSIDIARILSENEDARRQDAEDAKHKYDQILQNDADILKELQIHKRQMQEAMMCIHRHLARQLLVPTAPADPERALLRAGMDVMEWRAGPVKAVADAFVITSLDVIIRFDDRKLGHGGFASLYEGDWKGVKVAVKVFDKELPASILQREIDIWKHLRHPHVLQFFGACPIAEPPFIVCEFMENRDAMEYLRAHPRADKLNLLHQASLGLVYLHNNNVVHGDLKGSNILIDSHGKACLADFGLSVIKLHTSNMPRRDSHSETNDIKGTARWMAPEHMTLGVVNRKTDVYSFAMTMYEVFSGQPPFASIPDTVLLAVICDRHHRPLRPDFGQLGYNDISDIVWELMSANWTARPEDRQSVGQIADALGYCLKARPTTAVAVDVCAPTAEVEDHAEASPVVQQVQTLAPSYLAFMASPVMPAFPTAVSSHVALPDVSPPSMFDDSWSPRQLINAQPYPLSSKTQRSSFVGRSKSLITQKGWRRLFSLSQRQRRVTPQYAINSTVVISDKDVVGEETWEQVVKIPAALGSHREKSLTTMIDLWTSHCTTNGSLALEVSVDSSSPEVEVVRALQEVFKYGRPATQLAASRLLDVMLMKGDRALISRCSAPEFLETLQNVIESRRTAHVVRTKLCEVLADASYMNPDLEDDDVGFDAIRDLWHRVKPLGAFKAGAGIPFHDGEPAVRVCHHDTTRVLGQFSVGDGMSSPFACDSSCDLSDALCGDYHPDRDSRAETLWGSPEI